MEHQEMERLIARIRDYFAGQPEVNAIYLFGSILRMQVLKSGQLILNQNPKAVRTFFVQTLNEYFDLKRTRREIERNLSQVSIYDRS